MLDNMDRGVRVGGVVQRWQMPDDHHQHVGRPGHHGAAEHRLGLPRSGECDIQWTARWGARPRISSGGTIRIKQKVLQHVRGKEVGVPQRIERRDERETKDEHADQKRSRILD